MAKNESRELAVVTTNLNNFALAQVDAQELGEILKDNFAGEQISPFDLTQIQVGKGGVTVWNVKGTDDNPKEFDGVILEVRTARAYWETEFGQGGGSTPPDCASQDGITGNGVFGPGSAGNPSGACATCPMSKFGTAVRNGTKGKGIACAENRHLLVEMDKALIPVVVKAPPTSLKSVRRYLIIELSDAGLRRHECTTHFKLRQEKHGGFDTAVIALSHGAKLDPEAQSRIDGIRAAIVPWFRATMALDIDRETSDS